MNYSNLGLMIIGNNKGDSSYENQLSQILSSNYQFLPENLLPNEKNLVKGLVIEWKDGEVRKNPNYKQQIIKNYKEAIQFLLLKGYDIKNLEIQIHTNKDCVFSKEELLFLQEMEDLNKKATHSKRDLFFVNHVGLGTTYTKSQVFNANNRVNNVVEKVQNLSPFEKISYVYSWLTDRVYNENQFDFINSDHFVHPLTSNKIVCTGFSNIFIETLKKMGISAIQLTENVLSQKTNHVSCMVYIKDDKYNIDGYYYFDPTWDSRKDKLENNQKLKYFAVAPQQLSVIKKTELNNQPILEVSNKVIDIENNLEFFFPQKQDYLKAKEILNKIKSQKIEDEKSEMACLIRDLIHQYGKYFYYEPEAQEIIKNKAKEIILKEGKNIEDYNLNAYFQPDNLIRFELNSDSKTNIEMQYGFFQHATEAKFKKYFKETFEKQHPNFESKTIPEPVILKAYKVGMQQYELDNEQHKINNFGHQQSKSKKISLNDLLENYKIRNQVHGKQSAFVNASKQWTKSSSINFQGK